MSKLSNLYYAHVKEKENDMKDFVNGSDKYNKLIEFLQNNLNAKDFMRAEELLTDLVEVTREEGFKEGTRYLYGLNIELSGHEPEDE